MRFQRWNQRPKPLAKRRNLKHARIHRIPGCNHAPQEVHMSTVAVLGAQWGDEGKGKVVDPLRPARGNGHPLPGR